jgi:hypothetical protein
MKNTCVEVEEYLEAYLMLALDESERSPFCPSRGKNPWYTMHGGWVSPKVSLDVVETITISCPPPRIKS